MISCILRCSYDNNSYFDPISNIINTIMWNQGNQFNQYGQPYQHGQNPQHHHNKHHKQEWEQEQVQQPGWENQGYGQQFGGNVNQQWQPENQYQNEDYGEQVNFKANQGWQQPTKVVHTGYQQPTTIGWQQPVYNQWNQPNSNSWQQPPVIKNQWQQPQVIQNQWQQPQVIQNQWQQPQVVQNQWQQPQVVNSQWQQPQVIGNNGWQQPNYNQQSFNHPNNQGWQQQQNQYQQPFFYNIEMSDPNAYYWGDDEDEDQNENQNQNWNTNNNWNNNTYNNNGWQQNNYGNNQWQQQQSQHQCNTNGLQCRHVQPRMQVIGDNNEQNFYEIGKGFDPNLLNKQVIYVQPSPVEAKLNELRQSGQIFYDDAFRPTQQSLTGQWKYVSQWKDIKWGKISDLIQNPQIFEGNIEPGDIKQGQLGDCYYLAALAALAQKHDRIRNLFLITEKNQQRYYAVKMLYKGKWKTIDLDEYIPVLNNKPAFSKAVGDELWVILLEKAWAKLYSSYKRIESGFGEEGLHDLTGAHLRSFRLKDSKFDRQQFWKYLMDSTGKGYAMVTSSQAGSDKNQSTTGIVLGHAYTLLKAVELNFYGQIVRLVELRNPWGKTEAKTQWNDNDPRWNQVSPQQKQRIGYTNNDNDGTFFQKYEDFLNDFRMVQSAQINDDASYIYCTQKGSIQKGCYFRVRIHKQGDYSFQINQTPDRTYTDSQQKGFKYQTMNILIGRCVANDVQYYQGTQSSYRTIFKKHRLIPGDYVIWGKIFFSNQERDLDITLAVYGDFPCQIEPCPPQLSTGFKEKLFLSRAKRNPKTMSNGVFYNQQVLVKDGYTYSAVWNQSQKPVTLALTVIQNSNPSVQLKKPYKGQNQITQVVNPGGFKVILAKISDFSHSTQGIGSLKIY